MSLVTGISPESYKAELRRQHAADETARRFRGMDAYQAAVEAAWRFWPIYERVNRDFCPDDPVYSVARAGYTPAADDDIITYQTPASRKWRVLEIILGSEGTASAAQRAIWTVSTGGTTETAGNVPEKFDADSPASMFGTGEIVFNWSTNPTVSGQPKIVFAWNGLGGFFDWKAAPGAEVYHRNSEQVSFRQMAGTAVFSCTVVHEEL